MHKKALSLFTLSLLTTSAAKASEHSIIRTQPGASASPQTVLASLRAATVEPLAGAPAFPLITASPLFTETPEAEVFEAVTEADLVSDAELEEKAQITFFTTLLAKNSQELATWLGSNDAAAMRELFKKLDCIIRNTDKTIASALTQFESDKKILIDARSKQKRQMQQCSALQEKLKNLQETLKSEQSSLKSLAHTTTLAEQQAERSQNAFNKDNEKRTQLVSLFATMAEEVKSQAGPCKEKFDLAQQLEAGKNGFEVVEHEDGAAGKKPAQESYLTMFKEGVARFIFSSTE